MLITEEDDDKYFDPTDSVEDFASQLQEQNLASRMKQRYFSHIGPPPAVATIFGISQKQQPKQPLQ